jgi:manganese/iron transport system permease protein
MIRALLMSFTIAIVCSIFSCFLVLKSWSLMGDAISHAVLPGLVTAVFFGFPLILGAFASGFSCAILIGYVKNNCRLKEDTVMGIIFTFMFAIGLIFLTKVETELHLLHVLFGNILGILSEDLITSAIVGLVCSFILILKQKDFLLYCFDPVFAGSIGFPIKILHYSLLILLSLSIVSSLKAVGIILVLSMLISPGAIGFLLCRSFSSMLFVAVGTSIFSCLTGTILSFHYDLATAPLIVLIQTGLFLFSLFIRKLSVKFIYA